jgi:general secretion pathway protein G
MKTGAEALSGKGGFTLVEILVVVVIIGILASIAAVKFTGKTELARRQATLANISAIKTGISLYEMELGRLPASLDELVKEGDANWPGPFLDEEELPKDGWENDFRYVQKGKRVKVHSAGADGAFDTDDDIVK